MSPNMVGANELAAWLPPSLCRANALLVSGVGWFWSGVCGEPGVPGGVVGEPGDPGVPGGVPGGVAGLPG
jgi:hypothetical protein